MHVNVAHIAFIRIRVIGGRVGVAGGAAVGFGGACFGFGGRGGVIVVGGGGDGVFGGDVGEDGHGGVRRGVGNGEVRVDEDVVLSPVEEVVAVVVDRWGVCAFEHLYPRGSGGKDSCISILRKEKDNTHVVLLVVEPVEWGFGAVGAVGGRGLCFAVIGIGTAAAGDFGRGYGEVGC